MEEDPDITYPTPFFISDNDEYVEDIYTVTKPATG